MVTIMHTQTHTGEITRYESQLPMTVVLLERAKNSPWLRSASVSSVLCGGPGC